MKQIAMILLGIGMFAAFLAAFVFVSLPFIPPDRQSGLATVPPPPPLKHDGASSTQSPGTGIPADASREGPPAVNPQSSPSLPQTVPKPPACPSTAELVLQDFFSRHSSLPETTPGGITDDLSQRILPIALCILDGSEPPGTFLRLVNDSDPLVRCAAVEAIWDAQMVWRAKGNDRAQGLYRFWEVLGDEELAPVMAASVESLIQATQEGTKTNAAMVLMMMGQRSLPAVPHLIWASDNHASPEMRLLAMESAHALAPDSGATHELVARRGADPDSRVRRAAWRYWLVSWVVR